MRRESSSPPTSAHCPSEPDVVYAQDAYVAFLLADRFPSTPQAMAIHADEYDLWLPPQLPGVTAAVVALHDRVAKRARAAAVVPEIVRLRQPVDTERFSPRGPLRDPPRRALLLGNYLSGDQLEVVAKALDEAGIEWEQVGYKSGGPTREPERLMGDADIVIGKARVIVEAMSSGRAAYVYDHNGGDGWVTLRAVRPARGGQLRRPGRAGRGRPRADPLRPEGLSAGDGRCEPSARGRQPQREQARAGARAPLPAPQSASAAGRRAAPRARAARPGADRHRPARTHAVGRGPAGPGAGAQRARRARVADPGVAEANWPRWTRLGASAFEREQSLLAQRRVRLGLALARPLDRARRLFR